MPDPALPANPFFVVGSDRSGSTLFRLMLNAHSRLHVPRETWFLPALVAALPVRGALDSSQVEKALEVLSTSRRWGDLEIPLDDLRSSVEALEEPSLRDIVEAVFVISMTRDGKERWGDKTPGYVQHIGGIASLFPTAQFIHIIRDARDVCLSLRGRGWWGALPDQARFWASQVGAGIETGRALDPSRYLEISYEKLVMEPEVTLGRVCAFLGETYEARMLEFHRSASQNIAPWESEIHEKVSRPPRAADVRRWRHELTRREILVIEALVGRTMERVGQLRHFRGPFRLLPTAVAGLVRANAAVVGLTRRVGVPGLPVRRLMGIRSGDES